MAEGTIKGWIIAVTIFTLIIVGGVNIMSMFTVNNPSLSSSEIEAFNSTYNKFSELNESTSNIRSAIEQTDATTTEGSTGGVNAVIVASWNTIQNIFDSFAFTFEIFTGSNDFFGPIKIPGFVTALIVVIIITIIAFAIWAAVFQREP